MKPTSHMSDLELLQEFFGEATAYTAHEGRSRYLALLHSEPAVWTRPLFLAREIWCRTYNKEMTERSLLDTPSASRDFLRMYFYGKATESFVVLFLDARMKLIAIEEMFKGTLTQTSVYPREVMRRALDLHASGIMLAHNHPSGDTTPSHADIRLTSTIKAAGTVLDIQVIDHLIVGANTVVSLGEEGVM
jgi:DNA repair protein RadC